MTLLKKPVSLEEAGVLLVLLSYAFNSDGDNENFDKYGDFMANHLPAIFLLRSVAPREWEAFAKSFGKNFNAVKSGLSNLQKLCEQVFSNFTSLCLCSNGCRSFVFGFFFFFFVSFFFRMFKIRNEIFWFGFSTKRVFSGREFCPHAFYFQNSTTRLSGDIGSDDLDGIC